MTKVVIDPTIKRGAVTVTATPLAFDLDSRKIVDGIADAAAKSIAADIRASGKWVDTGKLVAGIRATGGDVSAPSDRLNRPGLVEQFQADISAARAPLDQPLVKKAIGQAAIDIVVTTGARR